MNIATRYAKALASTMDKQEESEQLAVYKGMKQLASVMTEDKFLPQALQNSALSDQEKLQLLCTASGENREDAWLHRFFALVLAHRREASMHNIAFVYLQLYRAAHCITDIVVETAAALSPQDCAQLEQRLERKLGGKVECVYKVNPKLIGGIRILTGDKLIDATYATQLETLRNQLLAL